MSFIRDLLRDCERNFDTWPKVMDYYIMCVASAPDGGEEIAAPAFDDLDAFRAFLYGNSDKLAGRLDILSDLAVVFENSEPTRRVESLFGRRPDSDNPRLLSEYETLERKFMQELCPDYLFVCDLISDRKT